MGSQHLRMKSGQKIAVPYYGALVRPKSGFESLYLVADVAGGTAGALQFEVCVWDKNRRPKIADWLQEIGVKGVICSDEKVEMEELLACEGIWLEKGRIGDASDLVAMYVNSMNGNGNIN
ncbi:hypothetical protein MJO47_04120 [Desulfuromonas sp. KJ2020]|uniref:hypothetical protein n=1 Tax=Desulfuromonas sp. KJ2020 TaxID=2919173 RepID=UPI0003258764|nr:hypothetical protein [Desulfuromonas sp. KJ2020]MCP3176282.1 hypothetical protein [Desulfuromonas sp. KJ2020]